MVKSIKIPQALTNAVLVVVLALTPVIALGFLATAS